MRERLLLTYYTTTTVYAFSHSIITSHTIIGTRSLFTAIQPRTWPRQEWSHGVPSISNGCLLLLAKSCSQAGDQEDGVLRQ